MTRRPISQLEKWERARVGATLKAFRELRGLTPDRFASAIPVSRGYLMNIEAGRKPLTQRLLAEFAALLDVPTGAIVRQGYFDTQAGDE